ncbi:MAG: FliM/FliN family flagellar motor switch protein [Rickettsiales bacterium]|nr:FliM/FliN family flagellar motor switch protein [Rickettsiales bacterium]
MSENNTENPQAENNSEENLAQKLKGFSDLMLNCQVLLGKIRIPVAQFLRLSRGSIIELPMKKADSVSVLVNNKKVADADIVIKGDNIAVEVIKAYKKPRV